MAARPICQHRQQSGDWCGAPPIRGEAFCFWHHPDYADEAAQARRMGGLRSRREHTVAGAYDLAGITTVAGLQRVLEIAMLDSVGLDNTIARARTLGYLVGMGLKALEVGDHEQRLAALEAAIRKGPAPARSAFDAEPERVEFVEAAS
ncbi:MAG: hypothetical protein FJ029_09160 [Actinobacteria bacterium]|nr:hypothetical protein [Actinomycetota bacterium]